MWARPNATTMRLETWICANELPIRFFSLRDTLQMFCGAMVSSRLVDCFCHFLGAGRQTGASDTQKDSKTVSGEMVSRQSNTTVKQL